MAKRRQEERTDRQTRELVDELTDNVLELARHPHNSGDPDRLRALLASFNAIAGAELDVLEELTESDDG